MGREFYDGNNAWYIINAQFQFGNLENLGAPVNVNLYIETLTRRVREYDQTGKLPTYMIFMDQHYYEINKARRWISYLEDPMHYRYDFPDGFEWMADSLAVSQAALREAVAESRLLQAEAGQYGQDWLRKRINKFLKKRTRPGERTIDAELEALR